MKTTKKISLISVLIILLGCVNIARADVCFLPDGADCAKGDTEGFWPCVGDDCPSPDGKCDASYNSRMSTNECGAVCTKCADANSSYYGLYKCPENTCNCNEYTFIEAFNECNQSCKVCRIAGDKNYGKYKCPAVPAEGCANPQCEDYTLTAEDECKDCDQCTNKNAPAEKQGLWKCTECDRNIYTQPIAELTSAEIVNHCYENETCGCYMKCDSCFGKEFTMQDCQNAGYDSAKNECNGKRGTVYEACCNTCDGYIFPTDLSKTSEGWSCTECPNSCDGGTKYSCSCKAGYHNENGTCVIDCQDTMIVASDQFDDYFGYPDDWWGDFQYEGTVEGFGLVIIRNEPIKHIATLGPYACNYKVIANGHIDDNFLIKDGNGTALYHENLEQYDVNQQIYSLPAGQSIHIYAEDWFNGSIAWSGTITLQRY